MILPVVCDTVPLLTPPRGSCSTSSRKKSSGSSLKVVTLCAVSAAFAACSTSLLCVLLLKDTAKNDLFKSDRELHSLELPTDNKVIPKQRQLTEDAEGVVWLMSFPNSGTSYTIDAVRELTGTTTGTNYGLEGVVKDQESTPAFPDMEDAKNGPFLHIIPGREINTPKLLLTKTHCSGYCSSCMKPEMFIETPRSFMRGCLQGQRGVIDEDSKVTSEVVSYLGSGQKSGSHLQKSF